ncbi:MAG: DUF6456 domain-containing protein [Cucumibacter sp.]
MSAPRVQRLIGFLQLLLAAGEASAAGGQFRVEADGRTASIDRARARELAAQGLISIGTDAIRPTPEALNWLRRQLTGDDPFAAQHRVARRTIAGTLVNEAESPLRRLATRNGRSGEPFLRPHHVEAGERVRILVERAGLLPRTTLNYSGDQTVGRPRQVGEEAADLTGMAIDARTRLAELHAHMAAECLGVVIDICGFLKGLQQVEVERGWPPRSAKLVLRIGLDEVAGLFGLHPVARGRETAPLRQWRDRPRPPLIKKS